MKTIGILGGMSPETSLEYYRLFISLAKEREPEGKYPELIIYSLNFRDFCRPITEGKDDLVKSMLRKKLASLEDAGADFALMASNTPHKYYEELEKDISIPLLSIVESTADVASKKGFNKVGLLGTEFTMTGEFYQKTFEEREIEIVVPEEKQQKYIHEKIMDELVEGKTLESTRKKLVEVTRDMKKRKGIEATILGCTELPLLLSEEETGFPVLNTAEIHVNAAYDLAAD
ncbi:amino acid racemase [Candidatus Bipolaricaulota bacterium]|nr:amino acid racemase [Candidatus Bipolaricaulota bacterium]